VASRSIMTTTTTTTMEYHSRDVKIETIITPRYSPTHSKVLLLEVAQQRYYSNDDGYDSSTPSTNDDVRQQKSAFLRAVQGTSGNESSDMNGNNPRKIDMKRKKTKKTTVGKQKEKHHSTATATKRRPNQQEDYRNNNNNNHRHRRNNRKDFQNSTTKKLTLDEFFANLEKTGESSDPMAATIMTTPTDHHNQKKWRPRQHHEKKRNNDENELGLVPEASVADMGSFFDEVNALVKRKQNENQETVRNRMKASMSTSFLSTQHNKKSGFTSIHRPSILDILPPPLSEKDNNNDIRHCKYDVESWNQYVKLLEENMEGPNFLRKFKKRKKIKSEIEHHQQTSSPVSPYDDETTHRIHQLVDWLRTPRPVVETHLPTLRSALRGEYEEIENNKNKGDDDNENENTNETKTAMIGMNTFRSQRFREELSAQRERFMSEMGWTRKQYEAANGVLVFMGSLCAKTCAAAPLDIAWSKLKETGFPMDNKDVLHNYLYVSSTFSLPKRKTTKMSNNDDTIGNEGAHNKNKSIFSVLDFLNETTYSSSSNNTNYTVDVKDEEVLDVSAEVAVCHDFLHEATEQSTGIHVRRLVSLGKANEAERLLGATMVR